jgi:hypothetical protein
MALAIYHSPFACSRPLAFSSMGLSSILRRISRAFGESLLFESLDHGDWRDVLLDLPAPLRSDLGDWTA